MDITYYLIKTTILICVGIFLANVILECGFIKKLSSFISPLSRALNLSKESIISIITCFFNSVAGKSTLAGFYKEGKVSDREVIATIVMSTFPVVLGEHLFVFVAPTA
ncbi:MAG: nucleoside recognition domain-containing protein, partial [Candidatus Methanospirareceae archaeon]